MADPRDTITKRQRARLNVGHFYEGGPVDNRPGELLTMGDGSQWFHGYSGSAPVLITDRNRSGLMVEAS